MLAMHMADSLLSPPVAIGLIVLAAAVLAFASARSRAIAAASGPGPGDDRAPMMGVLGAFVFAAQMINFPILPGTSGHLGGGVLLAIIVGPHAATLVMASILIIQCLIFQDGGLLALGANILNMGVLPCYLGYFLYRAIAGRGPSAGRLYLAVFVASMAGMLAGAALVPVEVAASGMLRVPFVRFLTAMLSLHVLVGLGEALITFGVVLYLSRVRPRVLGEVAVNLPAGGGLSRRAVALSVLAAALLLGGFVSLFASASPDALESLTSGDTALRDNASPLIEEAERAHEHIAVLPDYHWTSASGIVGTLLTLGVIAGIAYWTRRPAPPPHGHSHA